MTLAELVIKLSADTAVLRSDFEKGKRYAEDFAGAVSKIFGTIGASLPGLGAGGVAKELFDLANDTAKVADEFRKLETTTGLTAENLSGLREISGGTIESMDSLGSTLARAGKNIEEGFITPTSTAGKVLAALFTPAEEAALKLEPMGQRLEDVTRKILGLTDAGERDFAAQAIFGRGWTDSATALKKFSDEGLDEATKKAGALGLVMSQEDVQAAHAFSVAMTNAKMSLAGWGDEIGMGFIRVAEGASKLIDNLRSGMESLKLPDWLKETEPLVLPFPLISAPLQTMAGAALSVPVPAHSPSGDAGVNHQSLADLMGQEKPSKGVGLSDLNGDMDEFAHTQQAVNRLIHELQPELTPLNKALEEYDERLMKIMSLPFGVDEGPLRAMNAMKLGGDISKLAEGTQSLQLQGWQDNMWQARGAGANQVPQLMQEIIPQLKQAHDAFATLDADAFEFGEKASQDFTKLLLTGQGLEKSLRGLIDLFAEFILKTVVFQQLSSSLGQGNGVLGTVGSFFAGLAGGRASGGDVSNGQSYLVGEQGPEIFTPTTAGTIIPNDQIGGGSGGGRGGPSISVDARGADAGVEYRAMRGVMAGMKQAAVNGYLMTQEMAKRGA